MTPSISLSTATHPKTPTKTRTVTRTRSKIVEERTPDKVVSRSVTYTRTEVVTETPRRNALSRGCRSPVPTIDLSSDSEDTATPPGSPLGSLHKSDSFSTARSKSPTSSRFSSSISSTSSLNPSITTSEEPIPRAESDETIEAYYHARYPGKVPHPNSYRSLSVNLGEYYVISGGKSVGIFTDWNNAAEFVLGVRNNKYQRHTESWKAWLAYRHEWETKRVRVLGECQDTAPLETQIQDLSLGQPAR
ncbi:hypothetical protein V5O48_014783 [Marasmius crinis-equi]|uniref:Ribonuclease H1 N-terminal domain-containing protein n=1 Tax=Marasmius crinis-equi TaxID=585013 RepID=A0ABR3EWC1_9AGAR